MRTPNWRQALLPLDAATAVARGDAIELELDSADGSNWRWRGTIAGRPFEQTTHFGLAPCRVRAVVVRAFVRYPAVLRRQYGNI